ncbi:MULTISPECIES: hypothetical protein [Pseudomonas]|uniref:Uncharacterized protein n=1 Tax=Pseudomonas aphyarum TaxID=2942629 RepID=A0ABT5PNT7_9PSED|nr:hypothetical protein [Pseudomonas aphyarum]MDD0969344.1 hypothetical protein [Pseudomonas aphyarum]MDD1125557.1 hypothetical protein [Pseudomonas aphyarum]
MSEQRSLGLIPKTYASIQSLMGELIDRSFPAGLTGYVKEPPRLVLTIDGNESITLDSSAIEVGKDLTNEKADIADVTFKTQLETFQAKLGLSITQISQFFGVTRKSVYDWLDGTAPRSANSNRLNVIAAIIEANEDKANLMRLKGVWLTPINGKSFMDVISDETLDDEGKIFAASSKLDELLPRLVVQEKMSRTHLGNAHASDIDRVADLG